MNITFQPFFKVNIILYNATSASYIYVGEVNMSADNFFIANTKEKSKVGCTNLFHPVILYASTGPF